MNSNVLYTLAAAFLYHSDFQTCDEKFKVAHWGSLPETEKILEQYLVNTKP